MFTFSRSKERIEPLRAQVRTLQEESESLIVKHQEVTTSIRTLEASIEQYKHEYATLIKETEQIKSAMLSVKSKCERAKTLLDSLEEERNRWEDGSEWHRVPSLYPLVPSCFLLSIVAPTVFLLLVWYR